MKLFEVPEGLDQEKFLVWDDGDDKIIKYRTLPAGGGFDGVLQDKALVIKSGNNEVFRVDTNGNSFHKGVETFYLGIDIPNDDPNNHKSPLTAGNFKGALSNLSQLKQKTSLKSFPSLDVEKINSITATTNEPTIWGYTERIDGAAVLGQSMDVKQYISCQLGS